MTQKKFSRFLLDLDIQEDEVRFDVSAEARGIGTEGECDLFASITLTRNECSDVIIEIENSLENPELKERPKPKYLDNVEVVYKIVKEKLNLDGVVRLEILKGYVFWTLFLENKIELEVFLFFLKSEL